MAKVHLIIGGARSGKSRLAEQLAKASKQEVVYIATAKADDEEMAARIAHHQANRPDTWRLIESPLQLADTINQHNKDNTCLLIDCLTLWLSNCLCQHDLAYFQQEKAALLAALEASNSNIILVSNEVGHGIVPLGELSREFVDQAGWLHQEIAQLAVQVDFVFAGLPLTMKSPLQIKPSVTAVKPWWGKVIENK